MSIFKRWKLERAWRCIEDELHCERREVIYDPAINKIITPKGSFPTFFHEFNNFPGCCGATIIHTLRNHSDLGVPATELWASLNYVLFNDRAMWRSNQRSGIIAICSPWQYNMEHLLSHCGFRRSSKRFTNLGTGNKLSVWIWGN